MNTKQTMTNFIPTVLLAGSILVAGCSGGALTTREKGAGIGGSAARQWEV